MTGERLDTYIVLTGKMHFMCLKANSSDFRRGNIKPFTCVIPFPKQEASRYLVLKGQLSMQRVRLRQVGEMQAFGRKMRPGGVGT